MKKITKVLSVALCLIMLMSTCSVLFIGAQAATTAPSFTFEETAKDGNVVTYELKLTKGSFNALDLNFVMSTGVTCKTITFADGFSGGVSNTKNGYVSYANATTYSKSGTIITVTFTVPSSAYTIGVNVTNCTVCEGTENVDVTNSVSVNGTGESIFTQIINAIVSFFQMIINFFSGLFA